jgi:hypothetical protein
MATNEAFMEIATAAGYKFTDAALNDLVLYNTVLANDILIGAASNAYANIGLGSSNITFSVLGNTAASTIKFNVSNSATNALTILGTGNVGIGSAIPGYKLDVNGTLNATAINVGGAPITANVGGGFTAAATSLTYTTCNVGIGSTTPITKLDVNNGTYSANAYPTWGVGVIDYKNSGGMGGSLTLRNSVTSAVGNAASLAFELDGTTAYAVDGTDAANGRIACINDGGVNGAASLIFNTYNGTAAAERVRIASGGNLGIGTSAPAQKLSLYGGIYTQFIAGGDGATYTGMQTMSNATTSASFYMRNGNLGIETITTATNAGNNKKHLILSEYADATCGFVGIGTPTPTDKFHVVGSARFGNVGTDSFLYTSGQMHLWANNTGQSSFVHATYSVGSNNSTGDHIFYTGGDANVGGGIERLRIASTGNIGIGTATPSSTLHIVPNSTLVGTVATTLSSPTVAGTGTAFLSTLSPGDNITISGVSYTVLSIASNTSLTLTANASAAVSGVAYTTTTIKNALNVIRNGNVGINNLVPLYDLDVLGTTRFLGNSPANSFDTVVGNMLIKTYNKALTTTALDFTNICVLTQANGALSLYLDIVHNEVSSSETKSYLVPTCWMATNATYYRINPIASSGAYSGQDWAVEININAAATTLRLVRVAGATSTINFTCTLRVFQSQVNGVTIADSTTTGTAAANSGIYTNTPLTQVAGNVGIGTGIPSQKLHTYVTGGVNYITIQGDVGQQQGIQFFDSASRWVMYKPQSSTNIQWHNGAADVMTLTNAGVLTVNGSGITSLNMGNAASGTLAVLRGGTGVTTSTGSGNNVLSASPSFSGLVVNAGNRYSVTQAGEARYHLYNQGAVGEWIMGQKTGTSHDFIISKVVATTETDYFSISTTGTVSVTTTLNATTLQQGGTNIATTFAPLASPTFTGTAKIPQLLVGTSTDNAAGRMITALDSTVANATTRFITLGKAASANNSGEIVYTHSTDGSTANMLSLGLNGTPTTLCITAASTVGIGTTVPSQQFHVYENNTDGVQAVFQNANTSTGRAGITIKSGANTGFNIQQTTTGVVLETMDVSVGGIGTFSYGDCIWYDKNNTNALRFIMTTSGNMGIGTSAPAYKMHMYAASGQVNQRMQSGSTYYLDVGTNGSTAGHYIYGYGAATPLIFGVAAAERMRIDGSTGNVGIKNNSPSYDLHVTGVIAASSDLIVSSDRRLKSNLEVISDSLEKIKTLTGYTFNLTNASDNKRRTGLIAQEVEEVLPEVVQEDNTEDKFKSIAYGNMAGLIVEAIKSLDKKLDYLYGALGVEIPTSFP